MKPLYWLSGEIKTPPFSADARLEAGYLLRLLQGGSRIGLPRSRPMPQISKRCHELRIQDRDQTWRIVYAIEPDAIVILDVFAKKSVSTPQNVIVNAQSRIRQYRNL